MLLCGVKQVFMKVEIIPKTLHFKQPAGTSRGVYTTRNVWYIVITDQENPKHFGVGECAPLPALSCDDVPEYLDVLTKTSRRLEENLKTNFENALTSLEELEAYPSIRFGAETAKEVMTPRLDMVDLEINTPYSEVLNCVVENAYSRVPVYMDSRDNIKGILQRRKDIGLSQKLVLQRELQGRLTVKMR